MEAVHLNSNILKHGPYLFFIVDTLVSMRLWGGDLEAPAAPGWKLEVGPVSPLLQPGAPPPRRCRPAASQCPCCQEELQAQPEKTSPPGGRHHILLWGDTEDVSRGRNQPARPDQTNRRSLSGRLDGLLWLHVVPRRHCTGSFGPLWIWEVCVDGSRDTRRHAGRDERGGGGGMEAAPGKTAGHSGRTRRLELPHVHGKSARCVEGEPTGSGKREPWEAAGVSECLVVFGETKSQPRSGACVWSKVSVHPGGSVSVWMVLKTTERSFISTIMTMLNRVALSNLVAFDCVSTFFSLSTIRYKLSRTLLSKKPFGLLGNRAAVTVDYMPTLRFMCRLQKSQQQKDEADGWDRLRNDVTTSLKITKYFERPLRFV